VQTSDFHAASQFWSQVDRDVVDQAPWIAVQDLDLNDLASRQVGNVNATPSGMLLCQIWSK
jgi:hypothetical protein